MITSGGLQKIFHISAGDLDQEKGGPKGMWGLFGGGQVSPGVRKGFDLIRLERYDEAEEFFTKALAEHPKDPHAWLGRGIAALRRGDARKALEYVEYALTLAPNEPNAWYQKARALAALGKHEQALSCYELSLHLQPTAAAWYFKGLSLEALERDPEALDCYEKAVTLTSEEEVKARRDALLRKLRAQRST
jgi:tetratricopeptide (TPR) repeat protein